MVGSAGRLNARLQNALILVCQGKAGPKQALGQVVRMVENDMDERKRK